MGKYLSCSVLKRKTEHGSKPKTLDLPPIYTAVQPLSPTMVNTSFIQGFGDRRIFYQDWQRL
jgi:hypothetical protein